MEPLEPRASSAEQAVNFFGHAVVSRLVVHADGYAGAAPYALGAMLPDFASMCGGRIDRAGQPPVAAGIDLHHRTDAVFHHHPRVLELMAELFERLTRAGVSRGPARAGSHLGVELLLDGVLLADVASRALYVDAIAHPAEPLSWREPDDAERFAKLCQRLRAFGVPADLRLPRHAAERLTRALSRRPRLTPTAGEAALLSSALEGFAPRVEKHAEQILREVIEEVDASGRRPPLRSGGVEPAARDD